MSFTIDALVITAFDTQSRQIFFHLPNGQTVDACIYPLSSVHQHLNVYRVNNNVRHKLLMTPSFVYGQNEQVIELISDGKKKLIADFLNFIGQLSGKIPSENRVLFNLQSFLEWPEVVRYTESPDFRYRLRKAVRINNFHEFRENQLTEYSQLMQRFIDRGFVRDLGNDIFEYLGPRNSDSISIYLDIFKNAVREYVRLFFKGLSKVKRKVTHGDPISMLPIKDKAKYELARSIEYSGLAYHLMTGLFSFRRQGDDFVYSGTNLEKLSGRNRVYSVLDKTYSLIRKVGHDSLQRQIHDNKRLLVKNIQ